MALHEISLRGIDESTFPLLDDYVEEAVDAWHQTEVWSSVNDRQRVEDLLHPEMAEG
jgi:hypothetical protein